MAKKSIGGSKNLDPFSALGIGGLPSFSFQSGPALSSASNETTVGVRVGNFSTGSFATGGASIDESGLATPLLIAGGLFAAWLIFR